jgi:hypothetical protein
MNVHPNKELYSQDSLLDHIEQAMREKEQAGRADEVRHGLVAQVANATPAVNEAFRRTLRARVLAEGTEKGRRDMTNQGHALPNRVRPNTRRPVNLWRFALVTLAAILIVTLALTRTRTQVMERNDVPVGRPGSGGRLTAEDFDALAEALNRAPAPRTVVVYPDGASPIAQRVRHETVPLVLGKNATAAEIVGMVGVILPPHGFVDLVMAGAQDNDTTRHVRAAMEQTAYRIYHPSGQAVGEVYGALEHSSYLVGPADGALEPIGALFEGGIELVAGDVLDDPKAGTPLRIAFEWRTEEPVSGSPVTFVHLLRDDVELIAQRDAGLLPGAAQEPGEEWRPGEPLRDQFALLLPPTLPAGEYEIRVGIYDAATQMRYGLVEPGGGTYAVVQKWDHGL